MHEFYFINNHLSDTSSNKCFKYYACTDECHQHKNVSEITKKNQELDDQQN